MFEHEPSVNESLVASDDGDVPEISPNAPENKRINAAQVFL